MEDVIAALGPAAGDYRSTAHVRRVESRRRTRRRAWQDAQADAGYARRSADDQARAIFEIQQATRPRRHRGDRAPGSPRAWSSSAG